MLSSLTGLCKSYLDGGVTVLQGANVLSIPCTVEYNLGFSNGEVALPVGRKENNLAELTSSA